LKECSGADALSRRMGNAHCNVERITFFASYDRRLLVCSLMYDELNIKHCGMIFDED
jgi:hypothetical protein